ncbi:MAG TPA: carbohydrate porin [Terrimicrobiaceae bacterium]|nr:carbohydrate porin [Terrimicrobiaceae bacterium]
MASGTAPREFCAVLSALAIGALGIVPAHAQQNAGERAAQRAGTENHMTDRPSFHDIESSVLDADFSPGEATTNTPAELDEIQAARFSYLDLPVVARPLDHLAKALRKVNEGIGLRLGVAYTMLYLQPSGGHGYGAAGDLDFLASWTLIGRGSEDTGRAVLTTEYRFKMGDQPPSAVGRQIGTLIPPTNAFNDRGWVIRDAYWIQRLFNARLRIIIGRADPSDYVGAYWLQNVNNSFVNRHFSANPAVPFPGHGPLLGISVRPSDLWYITAGACNAYSQTIRAEFDTLFDEWDLFTFGEIGLTPALKGLGTGRYAFGLWHMDARSLNNSPADYGLTAIVDQNLTKRLQAFARYAYSDGTLTNVQHLAQAGVGLSGLLGRSDDLTGAALSIAFPRTTSRDETVFEIFHRFQVTKHSQLSFGVQVIFDPSNAPESNTIGVFYARLRASF